MKPLTTMLFILFFISSYYVHDVSAKIQDFIDNDTNPDEPSSAGTANHPYVGIPIGTWKITDLSSDEKKSLCQQQESFCVTECGNENQVEKNFCSRDTMGWICKCQNHVPDIPPYKWPVALSECQGRAKSCIEGCTYGATKTICVKACNKYFKCNQAGSPVSGLRIEEENQIPNYSLPSGGSMKVGNFTPTLSSDCKSIKKYYTVIFILYIIVMFGLD